MMEIQADTFGIQEPDLNFKQQPMMGKQIETSCVFDQHIQCIKKRRKEVILLQYQEGGQQAEKKHTDKKKHEK